MKRYYIIYVVVCLALLGITNSCTDETYGEGQSFKPSLTAHYLSTSTTELNFQAYDPYPGNIHVEAMNTPWSLSGMAEWLSIDPTSGTSNTVVTVVAATDTIPGQRISILDLSSEAPDYPLSFYVTVSQTGPRPYLNLSSADISVPARGGVQTIEIATNVEDKIKVFSASDWIKPSLSGKTLNIVIDPNPTNTYRSGYVTLTYEYSEYSYTQPIAYSVNVGVIQAAPGIETTTETLVFKDEASSSTIRINSEAPWTARTTSSWISVNPSKGIAGESELTVSVTENGSDSERKGNVYLYIDGEQKVDIPVLQKGMYIDIEQSELYFKSTESSTTVNISTSLTVWSIITKPDWLTVTPNSGGRGVLALKFTAADNPNTEKREGTVIIGNPYTGMTSSINVIQEGKIFGELTETLQFANTAANQSMDINTDGKWTAHTNSDWITLSPTSGTGKSSITVSVTENTTDDDRTGVITVSVGASSKTTLVHQQGRYFTVKQSQIEPLPSVGGKMSLNIATNQTWTAKVKNASDWITLSTTSGSGKALIDVTVSDNPSVEERTDTIIFTPENNRTIRVPVIQSGRYLTVSTTTVAFFYKGGKSEPIYIKTDGTYRIEKSAEATWLSITDKDNTLVFEAAPYTGSESRSAIVTLYLTGLKGNRTEAKIIDIEIWQYTKECQLKRNDYDEDKALEIKYKDGAIIVIDGYNDDESLEDNYDNGTEIEKENYGDDKNLE